MYASFLQRVEHARNTMNALQGSTLQSSDRGGMHIEYYPPFLIFVPIFINSHSTNLKLKNRIFWFLFQICTVQNEEALKTLLYKLEGNRYQAALTCISLTLRHLKEHHGMLSIIELKSLTIYVYVATDDVRIQFQGWFSFCICKISFYDMLVCNFRFAFIWCNDLQSNQPKDIYVLDTSNYGIGYKIHFSVVITEKLILPPLYTRQKLLISIKTPKWLLGYRENLCRNQNMWHIIFTWSPPIYIYSPLIFGLQFRDSFELNRPEDSWSNQILPLRLPTSNPGVDNGPESIASPSSTRSTYSARQIQVTEIRQVCFTVGKFDKSP